MGSFFVHDDPQHGRVIWAQSKLFSLLIIKLDVMHVGLMDLESILRMPNHRLLNDEKLFNIHDIPLSLSNILNAKWSALRISQRDLK